MFNPHQLLKNSQTGEPPQRSSARFVLQRMTDHNKSRWDEPIVVPEVLYMKFRLPIPNSSNPKQSALFPLSLIDFIKRAYDRCKDEHQARTMENELKIILARYEKDYNGINWQKMPLPLVGEERRQVNSGREMSRKQAVTLHKQYSGSQLLQPEENTSKTKMIVRQSLQKLQERLSKKEEAAQQPPIKKFTGFSDAPKTETPTVHASYINPSLRVIFNSTPPPPPQMPVPLAKPEDKRQLQSKALEQKFSRASDKIPPREITVVTSTTPEPVDFSKRSGKYEVPLRKKQQAKSRVMISRQQLTEISKVAEKVSDLHQVAKRFQSFNRLKQEPIKNVEENDNYEDNDEIIVGKNTNIDKSYLRITGRPDPDTVRPLLVLQKALRHFREEYRQGKVPYDALISQMKSIRQDLTVQHIRSPFTVEVYEENFKISLFENDIIQLKQCQANLWQLYREGLYSSQEQRSKFISYHFTTLVLEEKYKELEYMLILLPPGSLENPAIQDTLRLKQIMLLGNYKAFFNYYNSRDQMTRQLLNFYIDKVRMRCLVMISKTCGERISLSVLSETVGEDEDVIEALAVGEGAVIKEGCFMLKESYEQLCKSDFLVTKKVTNLLI